MTASLNNLRANALGLNDHEAGRKRSYEVATKVNAPETRVSSLAFDVFARRPLWAGVASSDRLEGPIRLTNMGAAH